MAFFSVISVDSVSSVDSNRSVDSVNSACSTSNAVCLWLQQCCREEGGDLGAVGTVDIVHTVDAGHTKTQVGGGPFCISGTCLEETHF